MSEKFNKIDLLSLSLEKKIKRSQELILEWFYQYGGQIYVSFSGGKDSTVLLHLVRTLKTCENVVGVFSDTGLEYPEIRDFVKKQKNIMWVKPKHTFNKVIEKYGWPIISKEQSCAIYEIKNTKSERLKNKRLKGDKKGTKGTLSKKWRPLLEADFKISNKCCYVMKKNPMNEFSKKTGLKPIIGTLAVESSLRYNQYLVGNCNQFLSKHPRSTPIAFWNEQDILEYITLNNLEIASVYGKIYRDNDGLLKTSGLNRTGCMFCMYGLHLEKYPNRFDKMKISHPKIYDYIMKKLKGEYIVNEYLKLDKATAQLNLELKE